MIGERNVDQSVDELRQRENDLYGAVYDSCVAEAYYGRAPRWGVNEAYLFVKRDVAIAEGDLDLAQKHQDMITGLRARPDFDHKRPMRRKKDIINGDAIVASQPLVDRLRLLFAMSKGEKNG
jgi:hypothetical protein